MDRKFYFGFLLLEQIAALSASISDLLEDPDFAKISTFEEYVSYKTSWLQFAAEAGYDCETPDFKTPAVRVVETFPINGFLTDAASRLGINLAGRVSKLSLRFLIDWIAKHKVTKAVLLMRH
jgi:hypothetical protein